MFGIVTYFLEGCFIDYKSYSVGIKGYLSHQEIIHFLSRPRIDDYLSRR